MIIFFGLFLSLSLSSLSLSLALSLFGVVFLSLFSPVSSLPACGFSTARVALRCFSPYPLPPDPLQPQRLVARTPSRGGVSLSRHAGGRPVGIRCRGGKGTGGPPRRAAQSLTGTPPPPAATGGHVGRARPSPRAARGAEGWGVAGGCDAGGGHGRACHDRGTRTTSWRPRSSLQSTARARAVGATTTRSGAPTSDKPPARDAVAPRTSAAPAPGRGRRR